jgi:hypothetical protein
LEGKIFIVHPFNWAALWVSPPKNNYIPQHLQNSYYDAQLLSMFIFYRHAHPLSIFTIYRDAHLLRVID